jgi:hypothetical protein
VKVVALFCGQLSIKEKGDYCMKKLLFFVLIVLLISLAVGCAQQEEEPAADVDYDFPENVEAMENVLAIVTDLGNRLNEKDGYYGDLHDIVVANGNRQGPEHDELYELFHEWMLEVGATYLYSFADGGGDYNLIIVDGAFPEDMDPYGTEYEKEPWTIEAFETGQPTVSKTTWEDDYGYGLQKSAYAPVFNSDGEVSFLLGIDYPVPELEEFEDIME